MIFFRHVLGLHRATTAVSWRNIAAKIDIGPSKTTNSMDTLPAEIVAMVTGRLSVPDTLSLGATCWWYHDLTSALCAAQIQRERDWLAHRERMRDTFNTINTGYYVMINSAVGVRSFKVIDQRCFRYAAPTHHDARVCMRMSSVNSRQYTFEVNWWLCKCDDGGYYLRYRAMFVEPSAWVGPYRVISATAFARALTRLCSNAPEPY